MQRMRVDRTAPLALLLGLALLAAGVCLAEDPAHGDHEAAPAAHGQAVQGEAPAHGDARRRAAHGEAGTW